jgi:hypothetical protein
MRASRFLSNNFFRPADLEGHGELGLTIAAAEELELWGEEKLVLSFEREPRSLILNVTNIKQLTAAYGDETDDWAGNPVVLHLVDVEVNGEQKRGIRVRIPKGAAKPRPEPRSAREALDDKIPF